MGDIYAQGKVVVYMEPVNSSVNNAVKLISGMSLALKEASGQEISGASLTSDQFNMLVAFTFESSEGDLDALCVIQISLVPANMGSTRGMQVQRQSGGLNWR